MWIARDEYGRLWKFNTKPYKSGKYYFSEDECCAELFDYQLGFLDLKELDDLTFENSPIEIEIKVKQ